MINEFLNTIDSPNTKRAYLKAIKDFYGTDKVTLNTLKSTTPQDIENYLQEHKHYSTATIKQRISALSSFFEYIIYKKRIQDLHNPFGNTYLRKNIIKKQKNKSSHEIEILSKKEIQKLLQVAENHPRDYAMIKLMLNTGIRRSEVVNLTPQNFIRIEDEWYLQITQDESKGTSTRDIWISPCLKDTIDKVIHHQDERIFKMTPDNVYKTIKKYIKKAGIEKNISPHILRHTAISHVLMNGADIVAAKEMAGHKSLNTTMRYVHFINKLQNSASRKLNF